MPPAHLALLGFSAPVVKADAVILPVVNGRGDRSELSATPGLMRDLAIALIDALNKSCAPVPAKIKLKTARLVGAELDERRVVYCQIIRAHIADPARTYSSLCRENDVPVDRFKGWLHAQLKRKSSPHPEILALKGGRAKNRAPVTNPNGRIL